MYKEEFGNIPNKDKVIAYLEEGYYKKPGKWVWHLWTVGKTAQNMAKDLGLDPDVAFACGALHDIGKMTGATEANHFYQGYKILRSDSYMFVAGIALSHSFQIKNVDAYVGSWNIGKEEKDFVADFIKYKAYTDYDLLIQLLDGLIKTEYLGIEARAKKVREKHGDNTYFEKRIERLYELQEYFQQRLKKPIENYMPRVNFNKFPYKLYRK